MLFAYIRVHCARVKMCIITSDNFPIPHPTHLARALSRDSRLENQMRMSVGANDMRSVKEEWSGLMRDLDGFNHECEHKKSG